MFTNIFTYMMSFIYKFTGNYVVSEQVGYGMFLQERIQYFGSMRAAKAYAEKIARTTNRKVVLIKKDTASVLALYSGGRRYRLDSVTDMGKSRRAA